MQHAQSLFLCDDKSVAKQKQRPCARPTMIDHRTDRRQCAFCSWQLERWFRLEVQVWVSQGGPTGFATIFLRKSCLSRSIQSWLNDTAAWQKGTVHRKCNYFVWHLIDKTWAHLWKGIIHIKVFMPDSGVQSSFATLFTHGGKWTVSSKDDLIGSNFDAIEPERSLIFRTWRSLEPRGPVNHSTRREITTIHKERTKERRTFIADGGGGSVRVCDRNKRREGKGVICQKPVINAALL